MFFSKKKLAFQERIKGIFKDWKIDQFTMESPEDEKGLRYCVWHHIYFEDYSGKRFLVGFYNWERALLKKEFVNECRRRADNAIKSKNFTNHFVK